MILRSLISIFFIFLVQNAAVPMNHRITQPTKNVIRQKSLKQSSIAIHGLHCGYYALWNVLRNLDSTLQCDSQQKERFLFQQYLTFWEMFIAERRTQRGVMHGVNNLEPDEIDALIEHFFSELHAQVTVICSKNQLNGFILGHGLSPEMLEQINRFRMGQVQAFIINTGIDEGVANLGTAHYIAVIMIPDAAGASFRFETYDSGAVCTDNKIFMSCVYTPILQPLERLFVTENFELLQARAQLAPHFQAVQSYCAGMQKGSASWEYVGRLEDCVRTLKINLVQLQSPHQVNLEQLVQQEITEWRTDFFGMSPLGKQGVIHEDYINHLLSVIESLEMAYQTINCNDLYITIINEPGYAFQYERLQELAMNRIILAYQQKGMMISDDLFRRIAQEAGIPQEIVELGIAQDQDIVMQ